MDIEKLVKTGAANLDLSKFEGDVVAVKIVNNDNRVEIGTVEAGGIAVQNVYYGSPKEATRNPGTSKSATRNPGTPKEASCRSSHRKERSRETMTFGRGSGLLDAHLTLLYRRLVEEGWIEGNEADFKALFSGRRDEDCVMIWTGVYGRSTLVELFRQLLNAGLITLNKGFTLPAVLEGHFKGKSAQWLCNLDKGVKCNDKAIPVIGECLQLMKTGLRTDVSDDYGFDSQYDADDDFHSQYDAYDHQDMHLHRR